MYIDVTGLIKMNHHRYEIYLTYIDLQTQLNLLAKFAGLCGFYFCDNWQKRFLPPYFNSTLLRTISLSLQYKI